jgi:hypothetical protein
MSIVAENSAYAQWMIPSQTKDAYKQQHIKDNNQTKLLTAARSRKVNHILKN